MSITYTIKADDVRITGVANKENALNFNVGTSGQAAAISTVALTTETSIGINITPLGNANISLGGPLQVWNTNTANLPSSAIGTILYNATTNQFLFGNNTGWSPGLPNSGTSIGTIVTSSSYTVLSTDYILSVDSTGGSVSIILPSTSSAAQWKNYIIKDQGGMASVHNITISVAGIGGTIDGASTYIMKDNYQSTTVYTNGTKWLNS